jgi:hypothetical protein
MTNGVRPNFLIVGAARSGTTSLYEWLRQHPQVFMPCWKEPTFFVNGYGLKDWSKYISLFSPGAGKTAIGEASVAYLASPESPRQIAKALGSPRIIIILRDPVRRAMSLYAWMMMEGYESSANFEAALAAEPRRISDPDFVGTCRQHFRDYYYFGSGLYSQQVERYLSVFDKSRVRFYLFEELVKDSAALFADVCRFLDIDPSFTPTLEAKNQGRIPRWKKMQYALRAVRSRRRLGGLAFVAMELNRKLGAAPQMNSATEHLLRERYRKDIMRLADMVGRDLSAWLG